MASLIRKSKSCLADTQKLQPQKFERRPSPRHPRSHNRHRCWCSKRSAALHPRGEFPLRRRPPSNPIRQPTSTPRFALPSARTNTPRAGSPAIAKRTAQHRPPLTSKIAKTPRRASMSFAGFSLSRYPSPAANSPSKTNSPSFSLICRELCSLYRPLTGFLERGSGKLLLARMRLTSFQMRKLATRPEKGSRSFFVLAPRLMRKRVSPPLLIGSA